MLRKFHRFKIWFILGIMGVMGIIFLGSMFRFIGFGEKKEIKGSLFQVAKQYYLNGSYKKASSIYEKVLVLEPENGNAILDLAIICDDYLNDDERAIELYRRYLELFPDVKKKKLIEEWIKESAQESLGVKGTTDEEKIKQMEKDLTVANKDRELLKQQVEDLSNRLFTIQAEFQKEKKIFQVENEQLASELSAARIRIGKLSKELSVLEKSKKKIMEELETAQQKEKTKEQTKQSSLTKTPAF